MKKMLLFPLMFLPSFCWQYVPFPQATVCFRDIGCSRKFRNGRYGRGALFRFRNPCFGK